MIRFRSLAAGAAIVGVLATGVALAQGPGDGPRKRGGFGRLGGPGGGMPLAGLDLSESQQQQVREVHERHRAEMEQARQQLRAAMDAQRQAIAATPLNEGTVRAAAQKVADVQTEITVQQARIRSEVWALLTPEQQAQAKKLQEARAQRAESRRERPQPR